MSQVPGPLWRWRLLINPTRGALLVHRTADGTFIGQVLQRRELVGFHKNGDATNYQYSEWQDILVEDPDGVLKIAPALL